MAQTDVDTHERSHAVVIEIADDAEQPRCCCVCTEPLERVAIGRCGHRDVCAGCATRIRFFSVDRRCCVCRTRCPTVLITRAAAADGATRQQDFYYYHAGTGARFDDRRQYRKAVKMCVKPQISPAPAAIQGTAVVESLGAASSQSAGADVNPDAPGAPQVKEGHLRVIFVVLYLCAIMTLVVMFGLFFKVFQSRYQRIAIVVAFGLLSAVVTFFTIWLWHKC